jgi:hypothetical protein
MDTDEAQMMKFVAAIAPPKSAFDLCASVAETMRPAALICG